MREGLPSGGSVHRTALLVLVFAAGAASVALTAGFLWQTGVVGAGGAGAIESQPATALLQEFQCRTSERKELILRGVEDGYDPSNDEPAELSAQAASARTMSSSDQNMFDNSQADNNFQDHAIIPSQIADGLIVIRMRPNAAGGTTNDNLQVGDRSRVSATYLESSPYFDRYITLLEDAGWTRDGDVYSIRISELPFDSFHLVSGDGLTRQVAHPDMSDLLTYLRSGDGTTTLDIQVQDDTAVDFWGVAVCVEPEDGNGLTLVVKPYSIGENVAGLVQLGSDALPDQYYSNPYTGDTPCETALPLACFLDLDQPLPRQFDDAAPETFVRRYWSGGLIAATPPVAASSFPTIREADAYCAAEFGEDWRVLTYHDGGPVNQLLGYGGLTDRDQRYWVDIRGQPYGTCWTHE